MTSLLQRLRNRLAPKPEKGDEYSTASYGQEGEDMILNRVFGATAGGFYVDIGAHHPYRFSNTFLFYKKGWTGINIDPIPGIKRLFDTERPNDINLELAIGNKRETLQYYNFKEKALNTFSEPLARQYIAGNWELENVIPIETFTLAEIFDQHIPPGKKIDFMSIDVEDLEIKVLESNDWTKYVPNMLVIEMLDCPAENVLSSEIAGFLKQRGYFFYAKTVNSSFFKLAR